jgi:hypothetical protein
VGEERMIYSAPVADKVNDFCKNGLKNAYIF